MRTPLRPRTSGDPTSRNGASSFHLWWEVPAPGPIVAASVTLEILTPPQVDRLYFWAMQVSFLEGGRRVGGGHLGLQHHPAYPGAGAVNWGGYDAAGRVLGGTASSLPSALGNDNTRDFPWESRRPYRLRVAANPDASGGWVGEVTDETSGVRTTVRALHGGGDSLGDALVWSEVFARCDHPSVAVRWSRPEVETAHGHLIAVTRVRTAYQARGDGGCDNTDSSVVAAGIEQRTNVPRRSRPGTVLVLA